MGLCHLCSGSSNAPLSLASDLLLLPPWALGLTRGVKTHPAPSLEGPTWPEGTFAPSQSPNFSIFVVLLPSPSPWASPTSPCRVFQPRSRGPISLLWGDRSLVQKEGPRARLLPGRARCGPTACHWGGRPTLTQTAPRERGSGAEPASVTRGLWGAQACL